MGSTSQQGRILVFLFSSWKMAQDKPKPSYLCFPLSDDTNHLQINILFLCARAAPQIKTSF